jgi:hypothetical protein
VGGKRTSYGKSNSRSLRDDKQKDRQLQKQLLRGWGRVLLSHPSQKTRWMGHPVGLPGKIKATPTARAKAYNYYCRGMVGKNSLGLLSDLLLVWIWF